MKKAIIMMLTAVLCFAAVTGSSAETGDSQSILPGSQSVYQIISAESMADLVKEGKTADVISGRVTVTLNPAALEALHDMGFSSVVLIIEDAYYRSYDALAAFADKPVFYFLIQGIKDRLPVNVTDLGDGLAEIGIAYDLKTDEDAGNIKLALFDYDGSVTYMDSVYEEGRVKGVTNKLAAFGISDTAETGYTDIKDHHLSGFIRTVTRFNLMEGFGEDRFEPDRVVSYEDFAAILIRLTAAADDDTPDSFFEQARGKGIIPGDIIIEDVQEPLTREDMAVILHRFIAVNSIIMYTISQDAAYEDMEEASPDIRIAAEFLWRAGVVTNDEAVFNPSGFITRAEAAVLLCRLLENTVTHGWARTATGKRIYINEHGELLRGLWSLYGHTYYFHESGYMAANEWIELNGNLCFFLIDGRMAKNMTVGAYWVGEDGARAE